MRGPLVLACGCLTLLVACEGARPSPAPPLLGQRADAIQGGSADATSTFAVTVLDDQDGICSGTLIAPNLVLTARHCVASDNGGDSVDCAHDQFAAPNAASTLRVSLLATAPTFAEAEYHATKVIVPSSAAFCGNDLALLVLDKVVPAAAATPATPAIDPPLTDRAKYGSKMTAIGYGITGPNLNDEGIRRARPNVPITCIPGDSQLDCALAEYDMTAAEMGAGNGLCEGDSGSGAFEPTSIASAHPIVMGVLSRSADVGGQCADSVYGRTDTASAFLIAAAKEAAVTGGYPPPSWTDPGAPVPDAGPPSDAGASSGDAPEIDSGGAAPPSDATTTTSGCTIAAPASTRGAPCGALTDFGLLALAHLARRRRRST